MTVLANRFEIERVAGKGGMGTVFRARDRDDDRIVAVKVVEPDFANTRFEREAELLAELADSAIVRYVAHGRLDGGRMYLAMEWLEGLPLDDRLDRLVSPDLPIPLPIGDAIAIATRIARALGTAHAKGIVHRDVKPANVILRDGLADEATLVDFGIARIRGDKKHATMTATGVVIGTPAYMAPEQARAQRVDARADVFSLGCVLFECLCGRPAFIGEHVVAVLAKILLESPPRVRTLRPDVPAALDALVAKMLEKDPDARPVDGTAVAHALDAIARGDAPEPSHRASAAVGTAESRLATVLLARLEGEAPAGDSALANLTAESAFADAGHRFDVPLTALANGTLVGVVVAAEAATDAAERAARCALAMHRAVPEATIVLATGRAVVGTDLPVGTAIDEAARILTRGIGSSGVFVDEGTAALVDARFEIARDGGRIAIVAERSAAARVRTIGGRAAPCVGRDRELSLLEATYAECIDEPIAQATLIVAPPGIGKSRLRRELLDRLSARAEPPQIWLGLADPVMQQAPLALAGDVFRRALGIAEDEPLERRREKVLARITNERAATFIGEIAGAPFDDARDPILRAARHNPGLLLSHVDDAVLAFASSELARGALVIVLEDVHWADAASLRLFRLLLEQRAIFPLMLLALARPSLDQEHPKLWDDVRCTRIVLQPLLKKAAARIARALLGDDAEVDAIVERADGNALFVEELARSRLDGGARGDSPLPLTVAAAAEARVGAIAPEARVVLRAGAVFGERFWRGGVAQLIGERAARSIDEQLALLEQLEVVARSSESRFEGEPELVFRHALVRDAAYAMLTENDRRSAHALAGDWLASRIDDAVLLAHHFEVGERPADAARWHVEAAEDALAVSAFPDASRHAQRALELGADATLAGRAHLTLAQVTLWNGDNPTAMTESRGALDLLEPGSADWFAAMGIAAAAVGKMERTSELLDLTKAIETTTASSEGAGRARAIARARAAMQLFYLGEPARADALLSGCLDEPGADGDPSVLAWLADARFERAFASGYPLHPQELLEAAKLYESIGDMRGSFMQRANHAMTLLAIGAYAEAQASAQEMIARHRKAPISIFMFVEGLTRSVAAAVAGDTKPYEEASRAIFERNVRAGIANRVWLAMLLVEGGHFDHASEVIAEVLEPSRSAPPFHSVALAVAAAIARHRGDRARMEELCDLLGPAMKRGVCVWGRAFTDVAHAEVLEALGRDDEARAALEEGVGHVRRAVEIIREWKDTFLTRRYDVARLVAKARERGIIIA